MAGLFDGVVGIDAVTAAKPNAAHLIEAVEAVGGNLARTVMVGDADTDAGAARAAATPKSRLSNLRRTSYCIDSMIWWTPEPPCSMGRVLLIRSMKISPSTAVT